jgi:hypothetical protein
MKDKLCCIVNEWVLCEPCQKRYCSICWHKRQRGDHLQKIADGWRCSRTTKLVKVTFSRGRCILKIP